MCGEFSKFFRCKHSYIDLQSENKYVCLKDGKKINEENVCEACEKFCSRFIEYPTTVSKIETNSFVE